MSWLNISDSISSLSTNITSFTREVLTEANEDYHGSDSENENSLQHEISNNSTTMESENTPLHSNELQEQIELLRSELSSKDQQLYSIEQENDRMQSNFEKHTSNLRKHIKEKDHELENLTEKLKNMEADFTGQIGDLTYERDKLANELSKVKDGWGDEWNDNSNNDDELENLKMENESFSNELMMKEIVLNSIESHMKKLSEKEVDVADFSVWLDNFLQEKQAECVQQSDKHYIIKEWLREVFGDEDSDMCLNDYECQLKQLKTNESHSCKVISELETDILDLQGTINGVENLIRQHTNSDFTINQFNDWLKFQHKSNAVNNESTELLNKIESEIRDFDDDDSDFVITGFSKWIEKVQIRIDELELELLQEQELRESYNSQRDLERNKLEELFNDKQKEIALLKVELYNKTSKVDHPVFNEADGDQGSHEKDNLNEQLNETHARCDALKDELMCLQSENIQLKNKVSEYDNQFKNFKSELEAQMLEVSKIEQEKEDLQKTKEGLESEYLLTNHKMCQQQKEFDQKYLELESQLKAKDSLQCHEEDLRNQVLILENDNSHLHKELETMTKSYHEAKDLSVRCQNVEQILLLVQDILDGKLDDSAMEALFQSNSYYEPLLKTIREYVINQGSSKNEIKHLTNTIAEKELLIEKEQSACFQLYDDLNYLATSFEGILSSDISNDSTLPWKQFIDICKQTFTNISNEKNALQENIKFLTNSTETLRQDLEEAKGAVLKLDVVDDIKYEESDKLQQLNEQIKEQEKEIEVLKAEIKNRQIKSGSGNVRFGALKRRLKEVESLNASILAENELLKKNNSGNFDIIKVDDKEELMASISLKSQKIEELEKIINSKTQELDIYKQESENLKTAENKLEKLVESDQKENGVPSISPPSTDTAHLTQREPSNIDQVHQISLMLTEKNEEYDQLHNEFNNMKSKLLFVENEMSDLELVREECRHLKEMLIGKEHQNKTNETISLLQSECRHLKQLLTKNDEEYNNLQQRCVEKDNELSDMQLLREECQHLKQMLVNDPSLVRSKDLQQISNLKYALQEKEQKIQEMDIGLSDMNLLQEECRQLKHMLANKSSLNANDEQLHNFQSMLHERDLEIKHKNMLILDLQNSSSNMGYIQEECQQLKQMLLQKTEESNSSILPSENENSFMLQVQQLEEYVSEKDRQIKIRDKEMQNKEQEIKQHVEELHFKKQEIKQRDEELQRRDAIITELKSSNSDMDLLHNECNELKKMLAKKEELFIEVQNDLDGANVILQLKSDELKRREELYKEMEEQLQETVRELQLKEQEYELLREELQENTVQDENIHILQTEYRHVEETLNTTMQQLNDTQEKLFEAETHLERFKVYENQYNHLTEALKNKDEELQSLRLQSSDNSILESETMNLMKEELNELKMIVFDKENESIELSRILEKKNAELQDMNEKNVQYKQEVEGLRAKYKESEEEIIDKNCFIKEMSDKILVLESKIELLETNGNKEENEDSDGGFEVIKPVNVENLLSASEIEEHMYCSSCEELSQKLHKAEDTLDKLFNVLSKITSNRNIAQVEISLKKLFSEISHLKTVVDHLVDKNNASDEELKISLLHSDELSLKLDKLNKEKLLWEEELSVKLEEFDNEKVVMNEKFDFKIKDLQSQILEFQELESIYLNEHEQNQAVQSDYNNKCLELNEIEDLYKTKSIECQNIEAKLTKKCSELQTLRNRYDDKCKQCLLLKEELANQIALHSVDVECIKNTQNKNLNDSLEEVELLQSQLNLLQQKKIEDHHHGDNTLINKLEDQLELVRLENEKLLHEHQSEKVDLSQRYQLEKENLIQEFNYEKKNLIHRYNLEKEKMIQEFTSEKNLVEQQKLDNEKLIREHLLEKETELITQLEKKSSTLTEEINSLRDELKKKSQSFLQKNSECDLLKEEVLQLEDKIYKMQNSIYQNKNLEAELHEMEQLKNNCSSKDGEIMELKLTLEDYQARLENSAKERKLLEECTLLKVSADKKVVDLKAEVQQLKHQAQELEVEIKHRDVKQKEVESKTARELERLRNHLMTTEDIHTQDVLELTNKEDELQTELNELKEAYKRKSLILQDSSKQFQDHVVSIEKELHQVSSERDISQIEVSKYKDKISNKEIAIHNLQCALEQLETDKREQHDYLTSLAKRKENELLNQIKYLTSEQQITKTTVEEASLAVKGITKLNGELQQKDDQLKLVQAKLEEVTTTLEQRNLQYNKLQAANDGKIDKFLIANLLMRYFQSPSDKRAEIVQVFGGLLGWNHAEILQVGDGSAPNKGWISNVWGFTTPKKPPNPIKPSLSNVNQSFSELFVKFLETETEKQPKMDAASLLNGDPSAPNVLMLSPTPDILTFHNRDKNSSSPTSRIPAPGQEIPRVHTHHAQTTLKTLLS